MDLATELKDNLGYSDSEVTAAYAMTKDQSHTPTTSELDSAKSVRDNWDPATTSINSRWRDGGVGFYFPKLDFSEVTNAYKAFHGNNTIKYFPEMIMPKVTNVEGMFWYRTWSQPNVMTFSEWTGAPTYGQQYIMYQSNLWTPFTLNIPNATSYKYMFLVSDLISYDGIDNSSYINAPEVTEISSIISRANINFPLTVNAAKATTCKLLNNATLNKKVVINAPLIDPCYYMYYGSTINVIPEINTQAQSTNASYMFYNSTINLSTEEIASLNIDTSNCTDMTNMFSGAKINSAEGELIELFNIDTSKCTAFSGMFSSLIAPNMTIDASKINFSNATKLSTMFYGTSSIEDFPSLSSDKVTTTHNMFIANDNLKTVGNLLFPNNTSLGNDLFKNCAELETIGDIDCTSVKSCYLSYSYKTILSSYSTRTTVSGLSFTGCPKLKNIGRLINLGALFDGSSPIPTSTVFTIEKVYENGFGLDFSGSPLLTHESLMNVINSVVSPTTEGVTATLKLGAENLAKLTEEEIAIAVAKNWNVEE